MYNCNTSCNITCVCVGVQKYSFCNNTYFILIQLNSICDLYTKIFIALGYVRGLHILKNASFP